MSSVSNSVVLGNDINAGPNFVNGVVLGNNSTAVSNAVSVGNQTNTRKIVHVADGDINATSTDAINGSQLYNALQTLGTGTTGTVVVSGNGLSGLTDNQGNTTTPNTTNGTQTVGVVGTGNITTTANGSNIQVGIKDNPTFGTVNINNAGTGTINGLTNTDLTNLGTDPTRGATEGQLKAVDDKVNRLYNDIDSVVDNKVSNTIDKKIGGKLKDLENKANAGTASAMAIAGLPQPFEPGQDAILAGIAGYGRGSAVALGYARTSKNSKNVFKVAVSLNNKSKFGAAAGMSHVFNERD